jgi:eukaryotic-like serine/threonine-protein kinase
VKDLEDPSRSNVFQAVDGADISYSSLPSGAIQISIATQCQAGHRVCPICSTGEGVNYIKSLRLRYQRKTYCQHQSQPQADSTVICLQPQASLIGQRVSHYRVLEVIGGGGMGMVYKAEDLKLGRHVALKFLPPELASDPVALQRFEREARAASSLDHPNIWTIHEVEEHDGQPFIVMQLLQGETLRDCLAAVAASPKSLEFAELLDIAIQICNGLQAAHEKGIIHRDIKPANIFLTTKGVVKILDFGLAKLAVGEQQSSELSSRAEPPAFGGAVEGSAVVRALDTSDPSTPYRPGPQLKRVEEEGRHYAQDDNSGGVGGAAEAAPVQIPADATLTRTGLAMGTAGYMSPEQVRGEALDPRTDIFSFGLVLYEMATGQRAFNGETAAIVHDAILHKPLVPMRELNSGLPAKLVSTIDKALEKDPDKRYQSAAEMRTDLERLQRGRQLIVTAPRVSRRWKWTAVAALVIVLAVSGGLYWRSRTKIKLTDKDTIVMAHFTNTTGDTVIDDALDWPLDRELQESPYLTVLNPSKVLDTLKLLNISNASPMYAPPGAKLTPELARQVCLRSDSRAYITASIANIGNYYHITLNALDCHSGRRLAKVERETNDRNQIVKTLGMAGHQLRRELGEPEDSLTSFNTPLEQDTRSATVWRRISSGTGGGNK